MNARSFTSIAWLPSQACRSTGFGMYSKQRCCLGSIRRANTMSGSRAGMFGSSRPSGRNRLAFEPPSRALSPQPTAGGWEGTADAADHWLPRHDVAAQLASRVKHVRRPHRRTGRASTSRRTPGSGRELARQAHRRSHLLRGRRQCPSASRAHL